MPAFRVFRDALPTRALGCFVDLLLPSENIARYRHHEHQDPKSYQQASHDPRAGKGALAVGPDHGHQPVQAHQHDEHDGGVHVGVAQVEEQLAGLVPEYPVALGQVDDEEDGESHQEAIGECQVEDERGGDGALSGPGQDAPDDEGVAGDANEESEAEDQRAHCSGTAVPHRALIVSEAVIYRGRDKGIEDGSGINSGHHCGMK